MSGLDRILARSALARGFVSDPLWGDDAARLGLRRVAALLDRLGVPQRAYPIIHVAGSKGKGSTCAILATTLGAAGHQVGLVTSPHLHTFRERIAVGGEKIAPDAFDALATRVDGVAEALEREEPDLGRVTALELLLAMALVHFADRACDVVVVETGMGGALDSTNVVTPVMSVIGPIELEHTAILGSTLAEVAANKAGIIKPGAPVAVAAQTDEALAVIAARAAEVGSPVSLSGRDWRWTGTWRDFVAEGPWGRYEGLQCGLAGDHQMANACLAMAAAASLPPLLRPGERAVREGLSTVRVMGRFERTAWHGRQLVLDGAHTAGSARALAATLRDVFPGAPATMVIGMADDKEVRGIAEALAPGAGRVIATRSASARAMDEAVIDAAFGDRSVPVTRARTVADALQLSVGNPEPGTGADAGRDGDGPVVVTGSLATVAEARVVLGLPGSEESDP